MRKTFQHIDLGKTKAKKTGLFSGNSNNEKSRADKVAELENDAQERLRRVGALRAQISGLVSEERKLETELAEATKRVETLRERRDELTRLNDEENELTQDVKRREVKAAEQLAKIDELREKRTRFVQETARLRAQISNDEAAAEIDEEEFEKLRAELERRKARRQELLGAQDDLEILKNELTALEEERQTLVERLPELRKKIERTKTLIDEVKKIDEPTLRAIADIWRRLPEDVWDKQLAATQKLNES